MATRSAKKTNERSNTSAASDTGAVNGRRRTSIANAATIDAKNPIPIDGNGGSITGVNGKTYVPFLGSNDQFAKVLIEAKMLSPTTLSCVSSKATYCAGHGWYINDDNASEVDKAYPDLDKWAKSVNKKQQTLNDIIKSIFDHKFTTGNAFVHIVRGSVGNKKFVKVYVRSLVDCRLSAPDAEDICTSVFYGRALRDNFYSLDNLKLTEIPLYSENMLDKPWYKDDKGVEHTMIHVKNEMAGYEYYGVPVNIGSLPQQIMEYKAARYNLDNYENNLVIGGLIVLKGNVTDQEARDMGKKIVHTHTGDGKRGRWVILSNEGGAVEGAEITPFQKEQDGSYMELDKHTEEKIYASNQWNKLLIGGTEQKSIGQGNSAYIRSVFDIANSTIIQPEQEYVIEKVLKPLFSICDEWMGTKWSQLAIAIRGMQPVSFLGDVDVNAIITKDEGREIIGKKPVGDERGKEFITNKSAGAAVPADPNNTAGV